MMPQKQTVQSWSRITAHELDELVRFQLQALWDGQSRDAWLQSHKRKISELIPPVMIWGPPGVGKSSVIRRTLLNS